VRHIARLLLASPLVAACGPSSPAPATPALSNSGGPMEATPAASGLTVTCGFADGWAAVVPRSVFKPDEEYTMQALIGLTEEPDFWAGEADYAPLAPYAARRCSDGVTFEDVGPDSVLLIGKAGTFNGSYGINGVIRELPAGGGSIEISDGDLNMTWPCISCPRVYAWNGTGWELRGEVLMDVIGAGAETTQRRPIGKVKVVGGQVRLKLAEEEDEVSHVDALLLEVGGMVAVPSSTELATIDGSRTLLQRGDEVELTYTVGLPDGEYEAVAAATGYYLPLASLSGGR
jgi:hypothetical protein